MVQTPVNGRIEWGAQWYQLFGYICHIYHAGLPIFLKATVCRNWAPGHRVITLIPNTTTLIKSLPVKNDREVDYYYFTPPHLVFARGKAMINLSPVHHIDVSHRWYCDAQIRKTIQSIDPWKYFSCYDRLLTPCTTHAWQINIALYHELKWYHHKVVNSVKCYPGGRKMDLISSISEIPSQTWYHCFQYTRRHHMSLISLFQLCFSEIQLF